MKIEIWPQAGLNKILLGMTKSEVNEVLGKPSAMIIETEIGCETWVCWGDFLDLSFDSTDNGVLSRITIRSSDAILDSCKPIGMSEEEFLNDFPNAKLEFNLEENEKEYYVENLDLSFWIIDRVVDNITIFPNFTKDGKTPIWPK